VLHPEIGLDSKEVDRFLDEADRMRRVKHRALVPVVRAGLLPGGRPYIAMPRLRGSTLTARLREGPMPLAVAMPMFEELADGLAALHDAGLVHRDIKPDNVFFLVEESRLVLLDLGIARDTADAPSTTTKAGMMRGTPAYMAPERFFGKPASVRSDLFELALLLYAMLTSKLPWDSDDPGGRLDPKPPSERGVLLPLPYNRVIMDALSVDMARRPESVRAFVAQLRAAGPSPSVANAIGNARTELSAVTPPQSLLHAGAHISVPPPALPSIPPPVLPSVTTNSPVMPEQRAAAAPAPASGGNAKLLLIGAGIALVGALGGSLASGGLFNRAATPSAKEPSETAAVTAIAEPSSSATTSAAPPASASSSPTTSASVSAGGSTPVVGPGSTSTPVNSTAAMPPAVAVNGMPPTCNKLIALMCDPNSGSTPGECTSMRDTLTKMKDRVPKESIVDLCHKTYNASVQTLPMRKASTVQPPGPTPAE
jgi:serine/threonine-protein kinase